MSSESERYVGKTEMGRLPLRAIVALAARCARRAFPLFVVGNDYLERSQEIEVLLQAIDHVEKVARGEDVVERSGSPAVDISMRHTGAASSAGAVAGLAAHCADALTGVGVFDDAAEKVLLFGSEAHLRFRSSLPHGDIDPVTGDYNSLLALNPGTFPEKGQLIDPSEKGPLGPLWPQGEPDWYEEGLREFRQWQRRVKNN